MALQTEERYRCPDPDCGSEIEVTKRGCPRQRGRPESSLLLRDGNGEGERIIVNATNSRAGVLLVHFEASVRWSLKITN